MSAVKGSLARSTHDAYERWAETYSPEPHNPLMRMEQQAMTEQLPLVTQKQVLDLACGSGRYAALLQAAGAANVVAVDFCLAMLRRVSVSGRIQADMVSLPLRAETFDLVVAGLAIGHAADLFACAGQVARVLRHGGTLLYSDFHPEACKAGLSRSFRDTHDQTWTLPPDGYDLKVHQAALAAAGLEIEVLRELRVGIDLQERFPGCERFYGRWHGLPLVFVVRARR